MTTKRLAILLMLILGGMSAVFLLPKHLLSQPVGIELALPSSIGEWWGQKLEVTQREIETLGPETEFSRKAYSNGRGDEIQVSIVLGGHDMNTSIHRPERCLPAQGWTVSDKKARTLALADHGSVSVTRLYNMQTTSAEAGEKAAQRYNLYYYWFVGHTDVTGSHFERTLIDLKDRLLKGYNQRWAYITVSAVITKGRTRFGRDERQTDVLIEEFIRQLVPKLHKESVERG
ncbi:MAG: exosortase C-terminal domain/associated protein EpsI [Verrucomicrobiota bacterium]